MSTSNPSASERSAPTCRYRLRQSQITELAVRCGQSAAPVFALNDWRWGTLGSEGIVPDAEVIARKAEELLTECPIEHNIGSGRLYAYRYIEDGIETATISLDLGTVEGDSE